MKCDMAVQTEVALQNIRYVSDLGPHIGMGIVYILSISIPVLINTVIDTIWCKKMLFYYCWTLATVLKFFIQEQWVIFLFVLFY